MQKGIELYAKTHKDDLPTGVGVDLITCDDTSSPEVGKRLAQELIAREKVNVLMGVIGVTEPIPKVKDPWKERNPK